MRTGIRRVIGLDFGPAEFESAPDIALEAAATDSTALVVTGDSASRRWAPKWLKQAGFNVHVATAPSEAEALTASIKPNIVVVDAGLRTKSGDPLVAELRAAHGDTLPLFALCGNVAEAIVARDAEATDIVRKPYDWEIIARRCSSAAKVARLQQELQHARRRLGTLESEAEAAGRARDRAMGLDRTTQLPNGNRFRSLLHKATTTRIGRHDNLGLLVIGLDNFRVVNDAVGYENGNRLLAQFADRLRDCLRDRRIIGGAAGGSVTAFAGRIAGARFGLVVSDSGSEQILAAEQAVSAQLVEPFEVAGQSIYITASIGAAVFPQDSTDADQLMNCADSAMREAKDSGSGFRMYSEPTDTSSQKILMLDGMLRDAVRNDDLTLAFQPINDTDTGEVVAAEALLRWHHAVEGFISPADFVPIAEKSGLMREIGTFVIREACSQLRAWLDRGMAPIRMAVNLSLCQLLRDDVVAVVATALEENDLDPALLELELSERGVLNTRPEVVEQVHRLKALGVRISIDDFGTGHAAIGYLKDLPIDVIKIDRSYVSGKSMSERDAALASGMVALANGLDTTVIAEGVETAGQLKRLKGWGAQEYQGFLCSPAVSGDDFFERFG